MNLAAAVLLSPTPGPSLRLVPRAERRGGPPWWERRAMHRQIVGGCPDHWWNPTARTTAACTCDRF